MVSYRLLPVLFILVIGFIGVTGENPEEVPCEEETTTKTSIPSITPTTTPITTTTVARTTTIRPCGNIDQPVSPYLRKNGYWCSMMFNFGLGSTSSYPYDDAVFDCSLNGLVVSSLEIDQEKIDYIRLAKTEVFYDLTAYWVGASLNTTTQQYYWDDGQAVGLMDPQPTVIDPNGHVAWFINKNSSVPGYGDYRVVAKTVAKTTVFYDLTAFWVGASQDPTTKQYYWDDGLAVRLMDPQPIIEDPTGHVAWFLNKNSSVVGYGHFRVIANWFRETKCELYSLWSSWNTV